MGDRINRSINRNEGQFPIKTWMPCWRPASCRPSAWWPAAASCWPSASSNAKQAALFGFDVRALHQLAPAIGLRLDERSKLLGRAATEFITLAQHLFPDGRVGQR